MSPLNFSSGPVYDAIVNSARSLGYSGDIVVLRGAGSGAVGAGLSGNTMVVFENAYANGFSAGTRFLSGDALIAHEVGHTLAPIPYTLNLSADPQLALLREIQASVYGAGIKGLSAESQAQLLQDASNVTELYLKRH